MKSNNTAHYVVLALLLALLSLFFYRSQIVDPHAYAKISESLNVLEQSEVALGQSVLENKSNLMRNYDPLVLIQRSQASQLGWLEYHAASKHLRDVKAAMDALLRYEVLTAERQRKVGQFKASQAVLRNSLNYLPLLVDELRQSQPQTVEGDVFTRLLADVLMYQQQPSEPVLANVKSAIERLKRITAGQTDIQAQSIHTMIAHASMIMRKSSQIESLLVDIMASDAQQQIQRVRHTYQSDYQHRLQQSRFYQQLMFTSAILLLIYALFFLLRLNQSAISLKKSLDEVHFYRAAIDEHAIVAATDRRGVITYANKKFLHISGYQRRELIGKTHSILNSGYHPKAFFKQMWATIGKGKAWHGEVKNRRKDGSFYWVNTTIIPELDESAKPFRYVAIRTDISKRKAVEMELLEHRDRLEKEVAVRTEELKAAKEEAEYANRQKSEFLANMSHELRTPLNAIIGFSDLLKDEVLGEISQEQHEFLGDIHSNGEHLLELINDILDLSKVEAGQMELELEQASVDEMLQATLSMVRERAMRRTLKLEMECEEDINCWQMDMRRIKQVIINLLANAIKFTPKGGKVHVQARCLDVSALKELGCDAFLGAEDTFLCLSVSDTGIGISPEDQKRLFKPFVQLEDSMTRKYEGTGLGLALSKKIIDLHDGHVWLSSKKEHGSTFFVALPPQISAKPVAGSGIVSWPSLLRHLGFAENIERRCHSPFALLRVLPAQDTDATGMAVLLKQLVRSHELIAHGELHGEYLVLMLNTNAEQLAMAEQRFCREMAEQHINISISHASCPEHAADAGSLLTFLKAEMDASGGDSSDAS